MINFRSSAAHRKLNQTIYRELYAGSPNAYLILNPDLKIINGNDSFVKITRVDRDIFAGKYMFDAFPHNPTDPADTGVKNLLKSFNRVLETQQADTLKFQRYDVRNEQGIWENRRWDGTSWAVIDDKKLITGLILHVHEYKSDELMQLLNEARTQIQKSDEQLGQSRMLADEVKRLASEVQKGRLDRLQTLRDLLDNWPVTMH